MNDSKFDRRRTKSNNSFRIILVVIFVLNSLFGYSQEEKNAPLSNIVKLGFLYPGISYERTIGTHQTLSGNLFLSRLINLQNSYYPNIFSYFNIEPSLSLQYRYYYDYSERQKKSKRTAMNSLNYISGIFWTSYSNRMIYNHFYISEKRRLVNITGVTLGLQRNYENRFSLDLSLGPGFMFGKVTSINSSGEYVPKIAGNFTLIGLINLGFWLKAN